MINIHDTEVIEITREEKSLLILALDVFASKYMKEQMNMLRDMATLKPYDEKAYEEAGRFIKASGELIKKINARNEVLC